VAVAGYLLGSVPVAHRVARRRGADLLRAGDRNPGYWNVKATLGRRAAIPVLVGDTAKGALGAAVGLLADAACPGDRWWLGYVGGGAAMVGHAWPVFARFRGGRSVLCLVGTVAVVSPATAGWCVLACAAVWVSTRRFDWAARVGVFGVPVVQALLEPRAHVAATGLLMSIVGLRFVMAALAARARAGPATG
jgi:glycerol-3-phosphate acyltransferase PlsY